MSFWEKRKLRGTSLRYYTIKKLLGGRSTARQYRDMANRIANAKGFESYKHLKDAYDDELEHLFELLAGPHGLTILKMIEARSEGSSKKPVGPT